jgi:hypothetical protein
VLCDKLDATTLPDVEETRDDEGVTLDESCELELWETETLALLDDVENTDEVDEVIGNEEADVLPRLVTIPDALDEPVELVPLPD